MPPKHNYKLIPDFIFPNLEKETYGRHLVWDDKKKGSFKISRIHQSSDQWNDDCIAVYKAWSSMKNLWEPDDPKKCTKAKHRLITALRRNPVVQMLETETHYYKFRFTQVKDAEKITSPTNEHNLSMENSWSNYHRPICSSYSFPSIKMLMTLPEKVFMNENQQDNLHLSSAFENESDKEHFTSDENSSEMSCSSDKNINCSDTCCCDVLLDSTLLSNERCIWHGVPN